jgi:hypothetical protein
MYGRKLFNLIDRVSFDSVGKLRKNQHAVVLTKY